MLLAVPSDTSVYISKKLLRDAIFLTRRSMLVMPIPLPVLKLLYIFIFPPFVPVIVIRFKITQL